MRPRGRFKCKNNALGIYYKNNFDHLLMIYARALFLHNVKIMLPTVFDLSEEALQQGEAEYQRNDSSEEQENRDDEASNGHAFLRTADADD